ncbi:MAG: hypothetical protein K9J38_01180 [Polynucleobacter sp.]|nr:hypothetical protein [Polynucleobacter sp.]
MSTKFLITPKRKNSLIKQEFYKKGKLSFYIESKWDECSILLDKKPKSKMVDGKKVTTLKNISFKDSEFNKKERLVIPDDFSNDDKKILRKQFKDHNFYSIDDYGWKNSKETYTLFGEFSIEEVPVHVLTLFTSEIEGLEMSISKEQFDEYRTVGMPYSDYEEFEDSVYYSGPIFDELTSLSVDDVEISDFEKIFSKKYDLALKQYEKERPPIIKSNKKIAKSNICYAVVGGRWIKRSWYKLTIYEEFDFSKMVINISRDYFFGQNNYSETFTLSYGDIDFDFYENNGTNSDSCELMSSDGKIYSFEILDDEDEEAYDSDDEDED